MEQITSNCKFGIATNNFDRLAKGVYFSHKGEKSAPISETHVRSLRRSYRYVHY